MQDVPASWTSSPCLASQMDLRHGEESPSRKSDVVMRHAAVPAGLRPIAHGDISRGRRWRYSFDQGADYFDGDVAWVTPKGPLERKTDTSSAGCGTCRREGSPAPPPSFDQRTDRVCGPREEPDRDQPGFPLPRRWRRRHLRVPLLLAQEKHRRVGAARFRNHVPRTLRFVA